ncbi:hypothetical protein EFS54_00335 [Periweissella beninensis]|nr:hypothetical protein [Periweissella beninensis]
MAIMKKRKTTKTILSKAERNRLWQTLTAPQKTVLLAHLRYQQASIFTNNNLLGKATDWQFMAYRYNQYYDEPKQHEQLYCACGRRLKHQYILKHQLTGEQLALGINHFADHTDIDAAIMRQLQAKIHEVNFGLDETLRRYRRGVKLKPAIVTWLTTQKSNQFSDTILAYAQANLPLTVADTQLVRQAFAKYERQQQKASNPNQRPRQTKKQKRIQNQATVKLYLKAFDW